MWVDREGFVRGGLFFKVDYKDFLFIFEAKNNSLVCRRNETISVLTTEDITELKEMLFITLTWDHSKIAIYLFSGDEQKSAEVPTRPFIPPVSLIREAKKMQLLPVYEYYTEEHLRSKVYAILVSIQGKIDEYGAINPFWDITYDGSKIVTRLPKKEPDIHPTIHGILSDQALMSSIEIIPENKTGVGDLDFAFAEYVKGEGIKSICIEFKHAHSQDVFNGLIHQLPLYMQNKKAKYGAYCVMYFKGEWFDLPNEYDSNTLDLAFVDKVMESDKPEILDIIRIFIYDFSKKASASKATA